MKYLLALIVTATPITALGADAGCKGNPALTGPCYEVTGTVFLSADIGLVLVPDRGVQTPGITLRPGHGLIINSAPNSDGDLPSNVGDAISPATAWVHGRYEVCPIPTLPSQFPPEETHFVCIEFGSDIEVIDPLNDPYR